MKVINFVFVGMLALLLAACSLVEVVVYRAREAIKEKSPDREREEAIYDRMKRYGINRDDVDELGKLFDASSVDRWNTFVLFPGLFEPGEYFRAEMDEYVMTMKVPLGEPVLNGRIRPYIETRQPGLGLERFLKNNGWYLTVLDLTWDGCGGVFPGVLLSECRNLSGTSIFYKFVRPEDVGKFSTPEGMILALDKLQKSRIPTQENIERSIRENLIDNRKGNVILLASKQVIVNGRVWIQQAMGDGQGKINYFYTTFLWPDRMLTVNFGLPRFDHAKNQNPLTYPKVVKEAIARKDAMIASLRISRVNDDGSPDPFVIERVEPAPLPIREKLPAIQ